MKRKNLPVKQLLGGADNDLVKKVQKAVDDAIENRVGAVFAAGAPPPQQKKKGKKRK